MTTLTRAVRFAVSIIVLVGAASVAEAGPYDSWWACVDKCCDECADCVDKCTDDFNSRQSGSGSEYAKFDISAGYRPGTPTIFYQPPERVQLRVGRYIGERLLVDPAEVAASKFYIVPMAELRRATSFESAPWQRLPDGTFDRASDMWTTWWGTSGYPDGPYVLRAEFIKSDGSVVFGGVTGAFDGEWCYADCDANGVLDFFDFLCFQNDFGAGDAGADCDGNGVLDFFDFLCFQNAFATGCS